MKSLLPDKIWQEAYLSERILVAAGDDDASL